MVTPLSTWPWDNLGVYKYILYGPIIGKMVYTKLQEGSFPVDWCFHVLLLCLLRIAIYSLWSAFSNMLFINQNRRINQQGYDFKQVDREWDWDNLIIFQALIASAACCYAQSPFSHSVPLWDQRGLITVLLIHVAVSEPMYYWFHRLLHTSYMFTRYHSVRHSSPVLHPFTGANATPLEQLGTTVITLIPLIGAYAMGYGSKSIVYLYILAFDFLRCFGNSNVELVPYQIFETVPILKHVISTPTYHSLHQKDMGTNFCLFMPIFDAIWKTRNSQSWQLHREIISRAGNDVVPGFVFLAHVVDITCSMHVPFVFRAFASLPFKARLFLLPCWPFAFAFMLMLWAWAKAFQISFYNLRGRLHHTWAVPRYGFQYFLPFAKEGINNRIEEAILKADKMGVKVISLAALNKNEALNGGGTLFVNKHPNLRVRVVHGNTLTAAVILNEIPKDVTEVFLTGATSKLGRAIALYLCQKRVRVLMLTLAAERFQKIQKEAPQEFQQYLVQVTKYQAAQSCKTWIVGKWITPREQNWAPKGTHFHQFVVPPILRFRRDCTYGDLAAMRLPDDVQGLASCEYTMDRGIVHACHAGGVVHFLEGYTHHEVGAIEVDRIDVVWNAAIKHGLKPV